MNHSEIIKQLDLQIKTGQSQLVKIFFKKLNFKKVPRPYLVEYAQLARRIGSPLIIIHLLRRVVRPENKLGNESSAAEKAIYGLGLFRLGAFNEAEKLLREISANEEPQVLFYLASFYINQWNYAKAIPLLRRYIRNRKTPLYSRLVARLNLCAALVSTQQKTKANEEIQSLMKILKKRKLKLLEGNLYEISSQLSFYANQLTESKQSLSKASLYLKDADLRSNLYIQKWNALIEIKVKRFQELNSEKTNETYLSQRYPM